MCVSTWHIAEINIARLRAPLTDPLLADFVAQLDEVNRIADESDGFVWRLKDDNGSASSYVRFSDDERVIVNMSVWRSIEALHQYVYLSHHLSVFKDRARWFERLPTASLAMWWIEAGQVPSLNEGRSRLAMLDHRGPTDQAFTFKHAFPPPV
jgi:hypothetical protein